MTHAEVREAVVRVLARIAPEVRGVALDEDANLREQLDLDSMDALNFAIGLHDALGVEIPVTDYAKLATLKGAVDYLAAKVHHV
jgi:acyl carrier protein